MNMILILAVLIPALISILVWSLGKRNLKAAYSAAWVTALCETVLFAWMFFADISLSVSFGYGPAKFSLGTDGFRSLYALVASFMWLVTAFMLPEYFAHYKKRERFLFFYLITFAATLGVFLSKDLSTTFIFFEIVSFASFVWVLHDETKEALDAAKTYLATAIFGGMIMLIGLVFLYSHTGTLALDEIASAVSDMPSTAKLASGLCLLFGFAAKAGMFPLHIWLPKAHPAAPAPASALLSGVLTKVGIYGIVAVSVTMFYANAEWGKILLVFGVITLLLGAFLALVSVNLKRTLACSSMSQIGFIITGIAASSILGAENSAAATGVVLYMLNHSMMKLILFSAAGVLYMNIHKLSLNDIKGWGRGKPIFFIAFLLGSLGLAGIPGTGGYIAKTLIHEAILECVAEVPMAALAEKLFLLGGGCTFAYMTKLFVILFVEKPDKVADTNVHGNEKANDNGKRNYMDPISTVGLIISCVPVLFTGIPAVSEFIGKKAAAFAGGEVAVGVHYFGWSCLEGVVITVAVGILVYFLFVRTVTLRKGTYVNIMPEWLELEKLVYVPLIKLLTAVGGAVFKLFGENVISGFLAKFVKNAAEFICHILSDSLDAILYVLKRSIFRASDAKRLTEPEKKHPIRDTLNSEISFLSSGITDNFSYALITTAVGVCVILGFLLFSFVTRS